ncbi:zinc-dependent metalloprotease [Tessaracoccus caeni]|uniref:zinc-dependent metalloprotease n=1 Tax=Tessaracoccus caeni TaxID=3031239 RepID=UPI0023DCBDCB|nr:zinc-dependent metalloprotease [Tessaracoccus caeni]MDF1486788.1 zinc-dependent metalloprotease [Tessaracoccus caeni]
MSSENTPQGPFDFEQLRRMLEQMGFTVGGDLNLPDLMAQFGKMAGPGMGVFGMTNADRDPDAAWLTTITAAKQLTSEQAPDPALTKQERDVLVDAERLAQSWLDEHTTMPPTYRVARAVTRTEWLDESSPSWRRIVEPIIEGLGDALEREASPGLDPQDPMGAMLAPLMRQSASLMYRDRLKRELSRVACDTLTGTEVGFNILPSPDVVLLPSNLAQFTQDLDASESDVVLYLTVREALRQRLFNHVGWLSPQIQALLAHFAREITIDLEAITEQFDPSRFESMSIEDVIAVGEQVRGSFFKPASTPEQMEILERLEVLLTLVEGWVDHVTARVTAKWMPSAAQLQELVRRRRAAGSPVRSVLQELIGLTLRPRLVRDAENLWAAIEHDRGVDGRDAVWQHPDLIPSASHLADPLSFLSEDAGAPVEDDFDAELRKLLDQGE